MSKTGTVNYNDVQLVEEKWLCSHGDVQLGKKLGNGNFGDVFLGEMTRTGRKVAVKTCKDSVPDPQRFLEEADV